MGAVRRALSRLLSFFRKPHLDADLEGNLSAIDALTDALISGPCLSGVPTSRAIRLRAPARPTAAVRPTAPAGIILTEAVGGVASGAQLLGGVRSLKAAPVGSVTAANRPYGVSSGPITSDPPSAFTFATVSLASSTSQ